MNGPVMDTMDGMEGVNVDGKEVALEALDFQVHGGRIPWLKQLGSGAYGRVHMARCVPEDGYGLLHV